MTVRTIALEALDAWLRDRARPAPRLVAVVGDVAHRRARIPGAVRFRDVPQALATLGAAEPVVVYCTGYPCVASTWAYRLLVERGYRDVYLFAGGLAAWVAAGLPIESDDA